MSPDPVAARLVGALVGRRVTVATCESLTGGLVGATITGVPGASAVYRGGLITYASDLKTSLAGVDAAWIAEHGVINAETALAMARGCARACGAQLGLSCTGVAGPDPQDGAAVGTVFVCAWTQQRLVPVELHLEGDRQAVREQTVAALLAAGVSCVTDL
ncbi:MAG: CinA family protein [Acidipropionibacterium acidipropionici]|jgi:nicotinamide-nucleotide amidase|uniref:Competence/damage-inducible protein CinA protein n=1 Tax=Acidipropionibacterium acidipropionici (strain ATCC 4875 / DSM 20272 / JCM 6432 / NBRC 12425 / NCIMB 8070 / 4) TaxID=1171373 RepID=K7RN12_ACIA4|nr:CinA family protein [Acidipropionibacterium acidipropionici]AFV89334.1 Competence/damage-inducible protein CinA protein [Acidipropionibacterium acidipropionici ATCC 4875]ALN16123.1 competence protein [Acidipropionibacterium acidipropionici]APZ08128.1 competence protein [Acidipropionibacterium acidipropionici]MDN6556576.1 CinA family protein [Acidipropionibacterium acidipropionici]